MSNRLSRFTACANEDRRMPASSRTPEPPRFEVGDRVVAISDIGGVWRPRVRRRTRGIVIARAPGGELEVHFDGDRKELVDPAWLTALPAG
jgi:hypothetical protein